MDCTYEPWDVGKDSSGRTRDDALQFTQFCASVSGRREYARPRPHLFGWVGHARPPGLTMSVQNSSPWCQVQIMVTSKLSSLDRRHGPRTSPNHQHCSDSQNHDVLLGTPWTPSLAFPRMILREAIGSCLQHLPKELLGCFHSDVGPCLSLSPSLAFAASR